MSNKEPIEESKDHNGNNWDEKRINICRIVHHEKDKEKQLIKRFRWSSQEESETNGHDRLTFNDDWWQKGEFPW